MDITKLALKVLKVTYGAATIGKSWLINAARIACLLALIGSIVGIIALLRAQIDFAAILPTLESGGWMAYVLHIAGADLFLQYGYTMFVAVAFGYLSLVGMACAVLLIKIQEQIHGMVQKRTEQVTGTSLPGD